MSRHPSAGFHPRMLVQVVREQAPQFPWLPAALLAAGDGQWESAAYVRFVSCQGANRAGSEWQFQTSVVINHQELGMVVIDVLKGNRVGGIELVDRILG